MLELDESNLQNLHIFVAINEIIVMHRFLILTVLLANTLMALAQNGLKGRVVEADGAFVSITTGNTKKT